MDMHVLDIRQVPNHAGQDNINLVLNRACMAAVANPQITAPLIGTEWNKQKQRALVRQTSGKLRKLSMVADRNTNGPTVCVDLINPIGTLNIRPVTLVRRWLDLILRVCGTILQKDARDLTDVTIVHCRPVEAANNVDVIADRRTLHHGQKPRRILRDPLNTLIRCQGLGFEIEQLQREEFWQHDKVSTIV